LLWECADQTECVGICRDLKNADIPYQVDQVPYERDARMRVADLGKIREDDILAPGTRRFPEQGVASLPPLICFVKHFYISKQVKGNTAY
jgi:hypothetical protein